MYNPSTFRNTDFGLLTKFIQTNSLGLLVTNTEDGILASSIPFLFYSEEGEQGVLRAHLAKANPHWKFLNGEAQSLIVFQGSHGYVTPSWYPSKAETHKVVPTWNYSMVQCRGVPRVIQDQTWLLKQITDLTNCHEKGRTNPEPWKVTDAPADFIESQMKAIVGIEVTVESIEGKFKMSQNRIESDREGVIRGMSDAKDPHYNPDVADLMNKMSG